MPRLPKAALAARLTIARGVCEGGAACRRRGFFAMSRLLVPCASGRKRSQGPFSAKRCWDKNQSVTKSNTVRLVVCTLRRRVRRRLACRASILTVSLEACHKTHCKTAKLSSDCRASSVGNKRRKSRVKSSHKHSLAEHIAAVVSGSRSRRRNKRNGNVSYVMQTRSSREPAKRLNSLKATVLRLRCGRGRARRPNKPNCATGFRLLQETARRCDLWPTREALT